MPIFFGLLSAVAYGTGDFLAGLSGKRVAPIVVTAAVQALGLIAAALAVLLFPGVGPRGGALVWGAVAGIGSAGGTFALYHGLATGRMSVVATLSGLLTAVIPALIGLAGGDSLSLLAAVGMAIAVPAIGLVSWEPGADEGGADESAEGESEAGSGAVWGALAGIGFALLFVALDKAGTRSGAWPLVTGEGTAVLLVAPFAFAALPDARFTAPGPALMLGAGVFSAAANLAFLAATHEGELAVVAILSALYPGVTVILARLVLGERWSRLQAGGLLAAFLAAVLVSAGSS